MMILADTSVWIDHFRHGSPRLAAMLAEERVVTHPFVIGELACGNLRNRQELLELLERLPRAPTATDAEVLTFIDKRSLMGLGVGLVDVHLLASVALSGALELWTNDNRLAQVAAKLDLHA